MTAPIVPAGWQPIETAPKDMASRLYLVGRYCVQGFTDAAGELNVQSEVSPHWRKMRTKPTHWMPLPPAPTAAPDKAYPDRVAEQLRTWRAEVARLQNLIQYAEAGTYPEQGNQALAEPISAPEQLRVWKAEISRIESTGDGVSKLPSK